MNGLSPHEIHEIRQTLGWSAREMGEFFDRTGVTIYHWENGKTVPGNNVMVLIQALSQELSRRRASFSDEEVQHWIDTLQEEGVEALIDSSSTSLPLGSEASPCRRIVQLANEHGGIVIRSESGETLAYVVPNTTSGLIQWARNLLETTAGEELLADRAHVWPVENALAK